MQSKAFQKYIKFITTGLCHAVTFSVICLSANISSLHDLPGLNPACSITSPYFHVSFVSVAVADAFSLSSVWKVQRNDGLIAHCVFV